MTRLTTLSLTSILIATSLVTACDTVPPLILQFSAQGEAAYSALSITWLRWAMALPASNGPIADQTGDACELDQHGKIWFLAGTFDGPVVRNCTIPANKALFFPLIVRWVIPDPADVDTPAEVDELMTWVPDYFAESRAATCELILRIDGEDILPDTAALDMELYVEVLEPFDLELNADNWATQWGKAGGYQPFVVLDGHFALLEPLPPGDHVLEFGGSICDGEEVQWQTRATYELHVEGGGS